MTKKVANKYKTTNDRRKKLKVQSQNYLVNPALDLRPMSEVAGFPVRPGMFDVNGATDLQCGVNFTIHTHYGTSCELLLFHKDQEEPYAVLPFPDEYKIGDVYSMIVFGLDVTEFEYAYRVNGPYRPKKGHLFDKNNILLDPYARAVAGQHTWGERKRGAYHARVVRDTFDWGDMPQSTRKLSDLIIYELHVRSFTQHPSSGVQNRGTFAGLMEKIPYLKELGINAVELMPIFEFDENMNAREIDGKKLLDYWGYNTVSFFAPNTSYTSSQEYNREGTELKEMIKALHDNGIEVILDVVFNHTAEGNEQGPSFCFKGLDNKVYYMLTPDGNYYNFSGCGNTLNCNHPVVRQMILECLRYWTVNYRVDGFRFDLASILGRNEDGSPMNNPPLLESLANDPLLANVKLIAEAWDAGGLYQVGSFPASKRWAEWNGRYRDSMRSYLKGECWEAWNAAWSICGSGDLYGGYYSDYKGSYAGYNSCINFITCHDGFTLYDLYSYNEKHNFGNGWDNTDGANDNRSWNCGAEGETDDPEVLNLRYRMIRNAFAVLMCSRGTPMFLAGDEFGNTQYGNNNPYCQDNEISWLDWNLLKKNRELFEFFKFMIAYRQKHPVIRKRLPDAVCGMDGLHTHDVRAENTQIPQDTRTMAVSFVGYDREKGRDDIVYVAVNTYWEDVEITLPALKNGAWHLSVNTYGDEHGRYCYPEGQEVRIDNEFIMRPRTVAVFTVRAF
ncbi:MAG: glycogen debranching protein GlgX [Clostridiales bacterium]|nr:glycogen debranching protein GlgX [Clostridiales bacterium]